MANEIKSVNPVFVNFTTLADDTSVTFGGTAQKGASILAHFSANGAKMGYGIGYAGLPNAGNISWDGPDAPFADAMAGISWGRAVLCEATVSSGTTALTAIDGLTGVCYGTTVKDSSVQLNAAIARPQGVSISDVAQGSLVLAIMVNASVDGSGEISETGETVVAISEAIDPTVFNAPNGVLFELPDATGGYTFTVRGTLAKAPFVHHVSHYTSMKDRVTSFPTSQAIIDAKASAE